MMFCFSCFTFKCFEWYPTICKHVDSRRSRAQKATPATADRNIYGVVTGAPSVMPTWFDTLKQSQSRVMVLIELGEDSTWVLMLVTRYRRPRGDEKAAILELTDDSGTV
jgi:hypothetical protein